LQKKRRLIVVQEKGQYLALKGTCGGSEGVRKVGSHRGGGLKRSSSTFERKTFGREVQ